MVPASDNACPVSFHQSPREIAVEGAALLAPGDTATGSETASFENVMQPEVDQERVEELFASFMVCLNDHEIRRQNSYREMRLLAVELAVAIATKLVFRELQADDGIIEPLVESLIGELDQSNHCTIWLNPDDHRVINNSCSDSIAKARDELEFHSDPSIAPGDCRVETGKNVLVSNIHSKLTEIRQLLLESLNDADTERRQPKTKNRGLGRFPERRAIG